MLQAVLPGCHSHDSSGNAGAAGSGSWASALHSSSAGFRAAFGAALPSAGWGLRTRACVSVLLVDLSEWDAWLPAAKTFIDAAQAERVRRRRIARQREQLALAYALHRLALAEALQLDPAALPLCRDERGRPWVKDSMFQTSLSHASGFLALAVTAAGPVGVDIERSDRAAELPEIAAMVCHRSEAALLDGDARSVGPRLLELWVRKEALLKAAGIGLARSMSAFAAPEEVSLPLSPISGASTRLRMLDARPHCVAAVAGPAGVPVECAWLRPRPCPTASRQAQFHLFEKTAVSDRHVIPPR